jgi:hypothetical protein
LVEQLPEKLRACYGCSLSWAGTIQFVFHKVGHLQRFARSKSNCNAVGNPHRTVRRIPMGKVLNTPNFHGRHNLFGSIQLNRSGLVKAQQNRLFQWKLRESETRFSNGLHQGSENKGVFAPHRLRPSASETPKREF